MGIRHYTDMGKWEIKPMCSERDAIERRRGQNQARRLAMSELAMTTAAILAEEEELSMRAAEEV